MASDRDRQAAALHRRGVSFAEIGGRLAFPGARAAHRAVHRGLAEPAQEEAMLRGFEVTEQEAMLTELTSQLWAVLHALDSTADYPTWSRVMDSLFTVTDRRCRLLGLYVRPWRCDAWHRSDVPWPAVSAGQRQARSLERQARVPWRDRRIQAEPLAPVVELRPTTVAVDTSMVPASVRALLPSA